MVKALQSVKRDIAAGKIAAIYVVAGNETWSIQQFLEVLTKAVVDPEMADFNADHFSAADISAVQVLDKAGTMPMMADRRLVIVDGCEKWKKRDQDAVTKALDNPNEQTCLVLIFEKADRRKKLFSKRSPQVVQLLFPKPRPWELPDTIKALCREMKLQLTEEAVHMVAELAGDDLATVHRELDKLSVYKLGSKNITAEDVETLMGRTRRVTRWELNDFLGNRDLHGALVKVGDILAGGEEPIGLLSAINLFFRQLFIAKAAMMKGVKNPSQMGGILGVPPKIASHIMTQQQAFSEPELRRAFRLMKETDFRLKSVAMKRDLLIDHLVSSILIRGSLSPPQRRKRAR